MYFHPRYPGVSYAQYSRLWTPGYGGCCILRYVATFFKYRKIKKIILLPFCPTFNGWSWLSKHHRMPGTVFVMNGPREFSSWKISMKYDECIFIVTMVWFWGLAYDELKAVPCAVHWKKFDVGQIEWQYWNQIQDWYWNG